jgi:hypothetical protein
VTSSEADDQRPISGHQQYVLRTAAVSWRDVDGEVVALDIASGAYFSMNGAGRLLWMALVESASVDDLTRALRDSYAIPKERAESDAVAFVEDLIDRQLVEALV